jgi:hypothetical protein
MLVAREAPGSENLIALLRRDLHVGASQEAGCHDPNDEKGSATHNDQQWVGGRVTQPGLFDTVLLPLGLKQNSTKKNPC